MEAELADLDRESELKSVLEEPELSLPGGTAIHDMPSVPDRQESLSNILEEPAAQESDDELAGLAAEFAM